MGSHDKAIETSDSKTQFKIIKETDSKIIVMSPLADPTINAIFSSEKTAGDAAASIIRVVLEAEGEGRKVGKVLKVTPQRIHSNPKERGCRVDVEVLTDTNEIAIFEIQVVSDYEIMHRNLFGASHIFTKTSNQGTSTSEMVKNLPTVIAINILAYNIRDDNTDVLQPFKIMYTKPPQKVAVDRFGGYNIQLPRLLEMEPDFNSGLYCWFYTLYTAHTEGKSIDEVIKMTPALQEYAAADSGYTQFCEQYNLVSSDPETQDDYYRWIKDQMRQEGERRSMLKDEQAKWQIVIDEQAAQLDEQAAQLDEKDAQLDEKDAQLDEQAAQLDEQAALITKLQAQLNNTWK
jgi:hypothetical protein